MATQLISMSISFALGLILSYIATKVIIHQKVPKLKTKGANVYKTFNTILIIYLALFNLFFIVITILLLMMMKTQMQGYIYVLIVFLLSSTVFIYFNILHKVFITKYFIQDSNIHDIIYKKNIIDIHALVVACLVIFSLIVYATTDTFKSLKS